MWNYRELLPVTDPGAIELAADGVFDPDESVVVINTSAGCKTPDKLGKAARERAGGGDGDGGDA
jgi:threonine synthase